MNFRKFLALYEAHQLIAEVDLFLEEEEAQQAEPPVTKKDTYLDPKTGSKWRAEDRWRQLEAVYKHEINKGTPPQRIWVTFSDVTKLGQRMHVGSSKSTPVGIFAFPARYVIDQKTSTPFSQRPYMHVFRVKTDHFEVGSKAHSIDPAFSALKDKYLRKDPVPDALKTLKSKLEKVIYQGFQKNPKLAGHEKKDWVFGHLNELLTQLMSKVRNEYNDSDGSYPHEKVVNMDLSFLDADASYEESEIDDAKEYLARYISKLNYYDPKGYQLKYKNVSPEDLSFEFETNYLKQILRNQEDYDDPTKQAAREAVRGLTAKTPKRFSFEKLQAIDSSFRGLSSYDTAYGYMKKLRGVGLQGDPVVQQVKKMIAKGVRNTLAKYSKPPTDQDETNIPHYDKLKSISDQFGLDLRKAVLAAFGASKGVKDPSQFLYRSVEALAKQYSQQHPETKWQTAWNKLFRFINIPSVADAKDSGYVHSSEKTQGVFMNPHDVEPVALIYNQGHSDQIDPASRPESGNWSYGGDMHSRTGYTISNQRKGPQVSRSNFVGQDATKRTDLALTQRIQATYQYLPPKIERNNVTDLAKKLNMLLQLVRSKAAINPQGIGEDAVVQRLLQMVKSLEASKVVPPQIKAQIDEIKKAAEGQRASGQIFRQWQPTDQERDQWWPRQKCPSCGHDNEDSDDVRCPQCQKFYPGKKPQTKDCQKCGYENDDLDAKMCPQCYKWPNYEKVWYDPNDKPPVQICPYCKQKSEEGLNASSYENEDMDAVRCPKCKKFYPDKKPQTIDCPCGYENENLEAVRCPKCKKFYDGKKPEQVKECPHCGYENEDIEDKQCPKCDDYYDEADKPPTKTCAKCSEDYDEEEDECPHCGAPSDYDPDDYQNCENCGHEFDVNDSQCPSCGYDPTMTTCDNCGTEHSNDESCPHCTDCEKCGEPYDADNNDECPHCGHDPNAEEEEEEEEEPEEDKVSADAEPDMECEKCHSKWNKAVWAKAFADGGNQCPSCKSTEIKPIKKESDVISGPFPDQEPIQTMP